MTCTFPAEADKTWYLFQDTVQMTTGRNTRKNSTMNSHMNQLRTAMGALMLVACIAGQVYCQNTDAIGIFASQSGVGMPAKQGDAVYDSELQEYRVSGSGKNMWFDKDEFHFVWRKMKGDFILTTQSRTHR